MKIFLCFICIIWFSSVDSRILSARVGSTAVLPCEWRNVPVQTPHVQWNTDTEIVFERKGEQLFEGEGYENRVDVPHDKLLEGNCSLVLKNVSVTDAGVYHSHLSVKRMKRASSTKWILVQSVEVSIDEPTEEEQQELLTARETSGEAFYDKLTGTNDAGANCPQPLIILFSLVSSLLFLGFCMETSAGQVSCL
ncbi:uncharacterized protein Hap1MRO34_020752 isoform 2-T2 [Clarias gariepinus]